MMHHEFLMSLFGILSVEIRLLFED